MALPMIAWVHNPRHLSLHCLLVEQDILKTGKQVKGHDMPSPCFMGMVGMVAN